MKNKRNNHLSKIPCTKFQMGACDRSSENCNYDHKLTTTEIKCASPLPNAWSQPLHKVQEQDFLPNTTKRGTRSSNTSESTEYAQPEAPVNGRKNVSRLKARPSEI